MNVRLALVEPGPDVEPSAASEGALERGRAGAFFAGEWHETEVLRGEPTAGTKASGPCVFELPEATLLCRRAGPPRSTPTERSWRRGSDGRTRSHRASGSRRRPGGAHPGPPRRDARGGRRGHAPRPRARRGVGAERPVHRRDASSRHRSSPGRRSGTRSAARTTRTSAGPSRRACPRSPPSSRRRGS